MFHKFQQIYSKCKLNSGISRNIIFICTVFLFNQWGLAQSNFEIHTAKKIYVADTQFNNIESFVTYQGNIVFTGNLTDAKIAYPKATVFNHKGYIYPGFIDAHCHFLAYCRGKKELNVFGITDPFKIGKMAKKFGKKSKRNWVVGRGWDQNLWKNNEFPSKSILDKYISTKPVCLSRVDGHAIWINSKALEVLKLNCDTVIAGGEIIKDKEGKPTGIFVDNAADWIKDKIPPMDEQLLNQSVSKELNTCYANGLTTIDEAGLEMHEIKYIDQLQKSGIMKLRVYAMMSFNEKSVKNLLNEHEFYDGNMLNVRSMKFYLDGALGSRGALMKNDYCDRNGYHGLQLTDMKTFDFYCTQLLANNYQVCVHAIGDSANGLVINSFKRFIPKDFDVRWRIEHAQVVALKDLKTLHDYSIIPSVQPTHATSDAPWAMSRICVDSAELKKHPKMYNPIAGAYAYKSLLNAAGTISLGTDFPVEQISTLATFYASTQRMDIEGKLKSPFLPKQALTPKQALLGMTLWAARANFEDRRKGSIETGKMADFIEIDTDIIAALPDQLKKAKITTTYINGERVWKR